ncbi:MAG: hypothetical protein U5L00_17755 [Desulfovermiculus sp.]|nr:hypothetical protein [Desulfovermiculus sp.]
MPFFSQEELMQDFLHGETLFFGFAQDIFKNLIHACEPELLKKLVEVDELNHKSKWSPAIRE